MTELNFNFCLPMIIQSKIDALNTKLLRLTLLDSHCLWTTNDLNNQRGQALVCSFCRHRQQQVSDSEPS